MTAPLVPLAATPVRLELDAVRRVAAPYCAGWATTADINWRAAVRQALKANLRALWRRRLAGLTRGYRRGQAQIYGEYDRQWRKKTFDRYAPVATGKRGAPWVWRSQGFFLTNEGGARLRYLFLSRAIADVRPASVLEVGCGNGLNLLLLACRFPEIAFAGVEFTASGARQMAAAQTAAMLPEALRAFSPEPLEDLRAHRAVAGVRGTAAALPYRDSSFDLVFTALALEQMEEIRSAALREVARVAGRYVLMLEPFRECNRSLLPRAYVGAHDYFRGAIADLPAYGLEPVWATADMPSKAFLRTALVLCRKTTAKP